MDTNIFKLRANDQELPGMFVMAQDEQEARITATSRFNSHIMCRSKTDLLINIPKMDDTYLLSEKSSCNLLRDGLDYQNDRIVNETQRIISTNNGKFFVSKNHATLTTEFFE